jgi:cytoskeleton protein RodZ
MSDLDPVPAGQPESEAANTGFSHSGMPAAEPTAGELLRRAREAAGMHIAALAVSLKVPVKKLEALEQDRFDLLPDAVFVRALASSVCRTLKLDAAPVLGRLPQTSAPKLTYQGAGINAPFRSPGERPGPSIWAQVSRPAVLAGLVLLLGALVLIFLPAIKQDGANGKVETDIMPPGGGEAVKPLPAVVTMAGPGFADDTRPAIPAAQAAEPFAAASAAATGLPSTPGAMAAVPLSMSAPSPATGGPAPVSGSTAATAVAALVAAAAPAPAASQAPPAGIVTFRAKGESWVEVTDAKGTVVLRRTLTAGEVVGASGVLPLAAVVGKADVTQVQVRGQAFDLNAVARDNVARFEVK